MNIGIVGLGLIGGSLGLDLKALGHKVFGVSRREQTCQTALALGVVDAASVDLSLLSIAEIIFICTPLGAILETVNQLIPHLSTDTVLTDVGSVKTPIVKAISPLWHNFIGGHPMAGTADSGIAAAIPKLFVNNPYVLTPVETTPATAVKMVESIMRSLKANIYYCRPEEHDRAVSLISHLPVFISAGLIATCLHESDANVLQLAQSLASSGFRDTSRVGGGNPELGVMMASYNRQELLRSLQDYQFHLEVLINLIEQEDWTSLKEKLQNTHLGRSQFSD